MTTGLRSEQGLINLGNLTVADMEKRLEITITDEERKWLEDHRNDCAQLQLLKDDQFHIFDIPFVMIFKNRETAAAAVEILKPYGKQMNGQLPIMVYKPAEKK